jgi:hypothetical protein
MLNIYVYDNSNEILIKKSDFLILNCNIVSTYIHKAGIKGYDLQNIHLNMYLAFVCRQNMHLSILVFYCNKDMFKFVLI